MTGSPLDRSRAPVAFGRRAVPQLFGELQQPEAAARLRALGSLCDLMHDPERVSHTVTGGFVDQLKVLLQDEVSSVRTKTCELLHLLTGHSIGRQALLSSSLLPLVSQLLDDSSSSCRTNVLRVLQRLALLPAGVDALLTLVPKLMLKLRAEDEEEEEEEEEEVQVLLLSTLTACSTLNALPALASDGVRLLGRRLSHRSPNVRREAAAAMMALSSCADGKLEVCEGAVLPVVVDLLQDEDLEVRTNAVGVVMFAAVITAGKRRCLELDVVPALLAVLSDHREEEEEEEGGRRKALVLYSLRALAALAEAPDGRSLLLEQLPLLERRCQDGDGDIRRAAQSAVSVVTWTP